MPRTARPSNRSSTASPRCCGRPRTTVAPARTAMRGITVMPTAMPCLIATSTATRRRGPVIPGSATARDAKGVVRYYRHDSVVTGWEIKSDQPGRLKLKNRGALPQERALPGHRARADERPGDRQVQDQLDPLHGPGRLRPAATDQAPGHRDPRLGPGRRRAPDEARQARPAPADLHGLAAAGGGRPVRRAAAPARGGGRVRLHVDPDVQGGPRGPVRGEAARRRRARRDRRRRLPGDDGDLPRGGALLVPELRPRPGQEDAGQLQEAAAERLRQAAAVRLALPRRRRGAGLARPARRRATSSSSTPARSCRSTATSSRGWR